MNTHCTPMQSQPLVQTRSHIRQHALRLNAGLQSSPALKPRALENQQTCLSRFACSQPHRRQCCRVTTAASSSSSRPVDQQENNKPAYNKYRTRADIEASYLRQWKEVTARGDGGQRRMTPVSVIAWWPMWFKYHVVPGFVRFLWWVLVWVPLSAVYREVHRYTVKLGARLDGALARRSSGGRQTFSLAMVLRRYHHTVTPAESAIHRWRLLKGVSDPIAASTQGEFEGGDTTESIRQHESRAEGFAS